MFLFSWFLKMSDLTFLQPLIVFYRRGNFVYHHWDLHKFIGNCSMILDPWKKTLFCALIYPFNSWKYLQDLLPSFRTIMRKTSKDEAAVPNVKLYLDILYLSFFYWIFIVFFLLDSVYIIYLLFLYSCCSTTKYKNV